MMILSWKFRGSSQAGVFGGDSPGLLQRRHEYREVPLQMLVQLQDGRHVAAPAGQGQRYQPRTTFIIF